MNKSMMAVGLALALSAGSAAVAAAQGVQGAPQRAQQHQQWGGRGGARGERRGGPGGFLLRGITLSDAQKTQLEQYRKAQRTQFQAERAQHRADFQKVREARQKGDTATAHAMMRQFRAEMQQRRDAQVAELRGILTPDQQKQLDANLAQMKQHEAERDANGMRRRGHGHGEHRGGANGGQQG